MKLRLLALLIFISNFFFAQNFHDTQGKLDIANSGQAMYTLPIALPPSIASVGPTINLSYTSGQQSGIAGQAWNINSISYISRMATRFDIDGFRDGVDFDDNDKLALDGQRLLLKSGTYWADGSIYETEVQSNNKIELKGSGASLYFIVTSPDGSRTWYGNYDGTNAVDATAYYITRFEDTNGNFITYHYAKPYNKALCISEIRFSANTVTNTTPLNKIVFTYKAAARTENGYVGGVKIEKGEILDKIEVYTNSTLFRKYQLTHTTDGQGYQRVTQVQEFNGNLEAANPVLFEYKTTTDGATEVVNAFQESFNPSQNPDMSGDFDGDGRLDFVQEGNIYTNLFQSGGSRFSLPFSTIARLRFPAITLTNGKLNQKQSIVQVTEEIDNVTFKVFNLDNNAVTNSYNKNILIANEGYCSDFCTEFDYDANGNVIVGSGHPVSKCPSPTYKKNSNKYLEGDFNGDGLSEVLILSYTEGQTYSPPPPAGKSGTEQSLLPIDNCQYTSFVSEGLAGVKLLDLNPNASNIINSSGYYDVPDFNLLNDGKYFTMDMNSDGKTDLFKIKSNGDYKIFSFKQLTTAPWIALEVIGEGNIGYYTEQKQILFGDYNGDGKPDIMLPEADGNGCQNCSNWYVYYSNPNPAGGSYFTRGDYNIVEYWPNSGTTFSTGQQFSSYYALDVNKDGKSDLVRVWLNRYYPNWWDPQDYDTEWVVSAYLNNIGTSGGFSSYYQSPTSHYDNNPVVAVPLVSNYKYNGVTNEVLMIRYQDNFDKNVTYVSFNKDFTEENLLKKVTQSEGAIVDEIEYAKMEPETGTNYLGTPSSFYSSTESLSYPLLEIKSLATNKLVSRISNTSLGITKKQDFRYHGMAMDMVGIGSLGFKKTARSSWYKDISDNKIWNVTENNPLQRNANTKTYTQLLSAADTFSFANSSLNLISKTESVFTDATDTTSKRYSILLDKQTSTDYLTGIVKEKSFTSYSSDYLLPLTVVDKNFSGTTLQGTTTTVTDYDNVISGTGSGYYIGRPKQVATSTTAYGNTQTSLKKYFYTNGNITRTENNVNGDAVTLVEDVEYFTNGLVKSKKLSATGTGTTDAVAPRTTSYTYDTTNRFVKTVTAPDGLVQTNNSYDPLYGQVLSQTNGVGATTTSTFDNWGKQLTMTDFLGKSITSSYAKANGIYTTTQTGDDGSYAVTENNALAQTVRKGTKDINGNLNYVSFEFDYLGRALRESQPYVSTTSSSQWTTHEYDAYSRPIKTTEYTGKIVTTAYTGLTVTVNDQILTKSKTMDANGNVVSATDAPGGTILFTYDAAGKLLESNYDGIKITTTYDNWGRKIKLKDPSAGTYEYSYNAFGELLTEISPKGTTTITLDDFGKPLTKRVLGLTSAENTDILSTYTYDSVYKWVTNLDVTNPYDGNSSYVYKYDTVTKQIKQTEETLPYATFTKTLTFDAFGRVDTETTTGVAHGKTSSKTIKHSYKNSYPWQLLDGSTVLWQADTFNARGQLTGATLGNGMSITNTYDSYGYATQTKHTKTGTTPVDIMTLNTVFEPVRGNLTSRYNSLFDSTETFTYDSLDRLVSWDGSGQNILTLPFNTTTDGFTFSGTGTTGSVTNSAGTLKVNLKNTFVYANRALTVNVTTGNKLRVRTDVTNKIGTSGVIVNAVMVETDPTNSANYNVVFLGNLNNGAFDATYTVSDFVSNPNLSLRFIIDESSPDGSNGGGTTPPNTTFYVDNVKIDNVSVNTQTYDDRGRITQNKIGTYNYLNTDKPYQNTSVTNVSTDETTYYNSRGNLNITYNAFKAPVQIEEIGKDKLSFGYNAMEERSVMYYGSTTTDKLTRPYRKYYSADGSMEVKYDVVKATVEFITYIGGDAYTAPIVLKSNGTTQNYFYLHRDYQGSIMAITNATAGVVEKRLFNPWGEIVKVQDGAGTNLTQLTFFDRGYTGHEHLQSVGLINMNARLYDPKIHRFLQPDTLIQDPFNTQNYNRYGYCVNNPMKYTDITGNAFGVDDAIIIGAAIGLASYFTMTYLSGQPITLKGAIKSAFIGGLSGAVTFGIGEWAEGITNFFARASCQAFAHGLFQGTMTGIQGGNFWSGFASGAISSIVSSAWQGGSTTETYHFAGMSTTAEFSHQGIGSFLGANNTVGTLLFGTISGGVGASLTKGNFWQGAASGLMVSLLNHAMHSSSDDNGYDENGNKISNKGGDKTDYLYDKNGKEIGSTPVQIRGVSQGEYIRLGGTRGYGVRGFKMATGAITDDSLNFTTNLIGVGELYNGGKLIYMGLRTVPKSSVGIRVVLGGSKNTLLSSVYFEKIIGSKSINLFGLKSLPTIMGTSYTWATFFGRNAAIIGATRVCVGGLIIYY